MLLQDDKLESVALESARSIDASMFVPADSLGWIWYDTRQHLTPLDRVIREAMAATNAFGISRVVLYRRERAVMLEPRGCGIG